MSRIIYAGPCEDGTYVKTPSTFVSSRVDSQHLAVVHLGPQQTDRQWAVYSFRRSAKLAGQDARRLQEHGHQVQIVPVIEGTPPTTTTTKENTDMSAKTNSRKPSKTTKTVKPTAASQGFPAVYTSETGSFRPGYDARAKADLKAAATGRVTSPVLHTFTKRQATALLKKRGW